MNARVLVTLFILLVIPLVVYLVFQRQIFQPGAAPDEERTTTFSAPTLINSPSATKQVSPGIAITANDTLHTVWSDDRDAFGQFDVFTSQSADGGITWENEQKLTAVPLGQRGRVASIASDGTAVMAVWGGAEGIETSLSASGSGWSAPVRLEESPTVGPSVVEVEARGYLTCFGGSCPQLQLRVNGEDIGLPEAIDTQVYNWFSFEVPGGVSADDAVDFVVDPNGKNLSVRSLRVEGSTTDQGIVDVGEVGDGTAFDCTDTTALIDEIGRVHKFGDVSAVRFNHDCVDEPGYRPPEEIEPTPHFHWSPRIISHDGTWYIVMYEEFTNEPSLVGRVVVWSGDGETWTREVVAEVDSLPSAAWQVLPDLAVDATTDTLHVVWAESAVQYSSRTLSSGSWSAARAVLDTGAERQWEPRLVTYEGTVGILTSTNADIFYLASAGDAFSSTAVLSQPMQAVSMPVIARSNDGVLQVVWSANGSTSSALHFSESTDEGATWSVPEELSFSTGAQAAPNVVHDSADVLHVVYQDLLTTENAEVFHTTGITTSVPVVVPVPYYGSVQFTASKGQSTVSPLVKVRVNGNYLTDEEGNDLVLEIDSSSLITYSAAVGPEGLSADDPIDVVFLNPQTVTDGTTVDEAASTILYIGAVIIDDLSLQPTIIQPEVIDDVRQAITYTYGTDEASALAGAQWLTAATDMVCSSATPSFGLGTSCDPEVVTLDTVTGTAVGALRLNYPTRLGCVAEGTGGSCQIQFNEDGSHDDGCTAVGDVCQPVTGDLPDLNATGIKVYKHPTEHTLANELSVEDLRTYLTNGNSTNDRVWFRAQLSNTGAATGGPFFTHWLFDSDLPDNDLHPAMEASSFSTQEPAIVKERTLTPGGHQVKFIADRLPGGVYEGSIAESNEDDNEFPPDGYFTFTVDAPVGVIGPESLIITAKGRANQFGQTPPRIKVLVDGVPAITPLGGQEYQIADTDAGYTQYVYNVPGITLDSTIDILALNVGATIDSAGVDEGLSTIIYIDSVDVIDLKGNQRTYQPEQEPVPVEDPPIFDEGDTETEMLDDIGLDYPHQMVCSASTPIRGAVTCDDFAVTIMKKGALRLNYDSQVVCEINPGSTGGFCTFKFNQPGANDEGCTTIGAACARAIVIQPTVCEADPLAPDVGQCVPLDLASVPGDSCGTADDCPLVIVPPASVCETDPSDPQVGQCVINGTASQPGAACTSAADCSGVGAGKADLDVRDIKVYESYDRLTRTFGAEIPASSLGSYIGQRVIFAAELGNTGSAPVTDPFSVKFITGAPYANPLAGLVLTAPHTEGIASGGVSEDRNLTTSWLVREGDFMVTFEADTADISGNDAIDEDNDQFAGINNNVLQKRFTVNPVVSLETVCDLADNTCVPIDLAITPGPVCATDADCTGDALAADLSVTGIDIFRSNDPATHTPENALDDADLVVGEEVYFRVYLENAGGADSAGFFTRWTVPGYPVDRDQHFSLSAGTSSTTYSVLVSTPWTVVPGSTTISFLADEAFVIDEADETNNEVSRTIVIEDGGDEGTCDLPNGLCVRAKAEIDPLNPEAPVFELMIDGNYVIAFGGPGYTVRTPVPNTDWVVYTFTQADLGRVITDTTRVSVAYLNDKYDGKATLDRNLVVDWVEVAGKRIQAEDALYDIGRYTHDHRVRKLPGYHDQGRDCTQVVPGQQRMTVQGMLRFNDTTCRSGIYNFNPGDIRGRVFIDENKDGVFSDAEEMRAPRGDVAVRLDYHMGTFAHGFLSPYFFTDTFTDRRHQVDIDVPAGWQVQYRVCENDSQCHTDPGHPEYPNIRAGRTALVDMPTTPGNGLDKPYLDIYWFVTPN